MLPRLEWIVDPRASILHIAAGLCSPRPVVNADRAAPLLEPAAQLHEIAKRLAELDSREDWDTGHFWSAAIHATAMHSPATAPGIDTAGADNGLAAAIASALSAKLPDSTAKRLERDKELAASLAELMERGNSAFPGLAAEVELRLRPLREQWEARGPGLLTAIKKLTQGEFEAFDARVHAVYPIHGGFGQDHLPWSSVRIEAVLANVIPELPEIVRLAWLLTTWSASASSSAARFIAIPIVLRAAEHVDLVSLNRATLATASKAWLSPTDDDEKTVDSLLAWFGAYESNAATIVDFALS